MGDRERKDLPSSERSDAGKGVDGRVGGEGAEGIKEDP